MVEISKAFEKENIEPSIAGMSGSLDDHLYMYHMPYSYTAEQIRKIRTHIFHMPDGERKRVIMVTSSLPSEGKSVIASNLAIAIAKGEDQHVLLVECDLRRPALQDLFHYPPTPGISEIIQGKKSITDCLIKTPIEKLTILSSAKEPPANPSELLESKKLGPLLDELAQRYPDRFLIIDTPPVQATVDPKIIADHVEGIVFVARYRYTSVSDFTMSLAALPREKILGIVLNAVDILPAQKFKYRKYNYHKYY
jgi:protein-tyrosine kinase